MTAYYPSQAGYPGTQPGVVYASTAGYGQPAYGMAGSYAQPGGVMYVPSYGSGYRHRRRRHHYYDDYRVPQVASMGATPMVVQPTYGHHYPHHHYSFGARLRRFFGLAPSHGVRYKSDRGTWGFMGYSRRQRYVDPRTGGEVDRQGRPVYRV
ncbi:hypothetical protein GALMADRAFT_675260 [Galerina marginata CBS 339.88]|uniref:Uncharacterized protein n=1 Tax=Galerina marginata (strain CBS 339.88) TaxID=685588 RepID=A0A067TNB0_GALM3|nr:hypothetical protein GALMADRAFT_675260 [Galerina marginata CBS 339.88]